MYRLLVLMMLGWTSLAQAGDWPQFLGPNRDGTAEESFAIQPWDKAGPKRLWQRQVGAGFAGPVIQSGRLILFHRVGDQELVECLQADDGKTLWKQSYPTQFEDDFGKGNGPRSTPCISNGKVVTFGADGWLHAWELESGKKLWGRNVLKDYSVPPSYFGVGTSPLIFEDRVLVNVGGKDAGIVAFALDSGKELWKATSDGASYSSPILAKAGQTTHAVFFTRQGVVLLDPKTGAVRFQKRWRARYDASVNAATPLLVGDRLFISASYETGALLLRLKPDGAEEVWTSEDLMSNHYNTCIVHEGLLFGFHGRQEAGASLRCVDLKSQKVLWDRPRFGCGSMARVGSQILILTEAGEMILVDASGNEYRERARAQVLPAGPVRAQIAVANGMLLARDRDHLAAFKLK